MVLGWGTFQSAERLWEGGARSAFKGRGARPRRNWDVWQMLVTKMCVKRCLTIDLDYTDWNQIKGLSMGAMAEQITDAV